MDGLGIVPSIAPKRESGANLSMKLWGLSGTVVSFTPGEFST
jgi:hypothetical protein